MSAQRGDSLREHEERVDRAAEKLAAILQQNGVTVPTNSYGRITVWRWAEEIVDRADDRL